MISIGVDIEDISRFDNRDEKFLKRIFTESEIKYCLENKNPSPHFCARFCAKEAVVKALGDKSIPYSKIEVLKNPDGSVGLRVLVEKYKDYNFSLSISHEKNKAIAFVVIN